MLVQRPMCPDLGRTVSVTRLLARIAKNWQYRGALDQLIDADLATACEQGASLRVIHAETGIPKSTAHDRVQRHRASDGEVAA